MISGITPQKRKTVNGLTMDDSPSLTDRLASSKPPATVGTTAQAAKTNEGIRSSLGIETVLTPKGKKRLKGLRGGAPEELATLLGE